MEQTWIRKLCHGYAAIKDDNLIAYLIGEYITQPWGRCGYVYLPGYALDDNYPVTVLQDLYSMLGDEWVNNGVFTHSLNIMATDKYILDSFFNLGFGKERVEALLSLQNLTIPPINKPEKVNVRKVTKGDENHLGSLSSVISKSLAKAPYWHPTVPEDFDDLYQGWSDLVDDKEWNVLLALENEKALGSIGFEFKKESDTEMLISSKIIYLSVAATIPEARGKGISTYLTWIGLEEAIQNGFETCYANWISPSILASRFWPRFGFKDVAYRITKRINPMISWTKQC